MSFEPPVHFGIRPLIRGSILGLYLTLVAPLIGLSWHHGGGGLLALAALIGFLGLMGILSQRVGVTPRGMGSDYPAWVPPFLQQRWSVNWGDVTEIEAVTTGQGGLVYYLITRSGSRILIPLRAENLPKLLAAIQHFTGIPTAAMRPYVQTWMYGGLSVGAGVMLLVDVGVLLLGLTH